MDVGLCGNLQGKTWYVPYYVPYYFIIASAVYAASLTDQPNQSLSGYGLEKNFNKIAKMYYHTNSRELMPELNDLPMHETPLTYFGGVAETAKYMRAATFPKAELAFRGGVSAAIVIGNQYINQYQVNMPSLSWGRFGLDFPLTQPNGSNK